MQDRVGNGFGTLFLGFWQVSGGNGEKGEEKEVFLRGNSGKTVMDREYGKCDASFWRESPGIGHEVEKPGFWGSFLGFLSCKARE